MSDKYMRLRGDGINVTRYRGDKDNKTVHLYLDVLGQYTVTDLITFIRNQGARPERTTFTGGCFVIEVPSTPEDVSRWKQAEDKREETAKQRRHEWYLRLREEFGDEDADG